MIVAGILLLLHCYAILGACERYAWFTASSSAPNKCHLLLQSAIESVLTHSPNLFPIVLFEGALFSDVLPWLRVLHNHKQIKVIPHQLSWIDLLSDKRRSVSAAYLRLDIPVLFDSVLESIPFLNKQYILYTDCDVLFYKRVLFLRPELFTMGPEMWKGTKENSGVMFMNVTAMKPLMNGFVQHAKVFSIQHPHLDDQPMILTYFDKEKISRLPDEYNWKPYWGFNSSATIVHTHGTKFSSCLEAFLIYRYNPRHNFGSKANCINAKAYSRVQQLTSRRYNISFDEQMDSYLRYGLDLYSLLSKMNERLLNLTLGTPVSSQ